jgi:hypothetical protein
MEKDTTLLRDTLDMMILQSLARGAKHGYAISEFIRISSREVLQVERAPSTRRCTGSNCAAGSHRSGECRPTTAGPSITTLLQQGENS